MKAHVLTTTTSASSGAAAGTSPSASIVPVSLSESTWFFGQPRVSTQKESATASKLPGGLASQDGDDRDDQSDDGQEHRQRARHGGRAGAPGRAAGPGRLPNLGPSRVRRTPRAAAARPRPHAGPG